MNDGNVLVCYTDGSAQPNPGYAGYGLYGYLLKPSKRPRSINYHVKGNFKYTSGGFVDQREKEYDNYKDESFECLGMVEHIGSINSDNATNNQGEVMGLITAIRYALSLENVSKLLVISDSKYALTCYSKYLKHWEKNGFKNRNGADIKNLDLWMTLVELNIQLSNRKIKVETKWVKGHKDDVGNIVADMYALVGTNYARNQLTEGVEEFDECILSAFTKPSDFKKELDDRHYFLNYKLGLFHTGVPTFNSQMLISTFQDDGEPENVLGKRNLSCAYALAIGSNIPSVFTNLKFNFNSIPRVTQRNAIINLDTIKKDKIVTRLVNKIGFEPLLVKSVVNDLNRHNFFNKDGVIVEELPLRFTHMLEVYEMYNLFDVAHIKLDVLKENDKLIDVTEDFYDENSKCRIVYQDKDHDYSKRFQDKGIPITSSIFIRYDRDVPSYQTLTQLEGRNNKVYLYPDITRNKNMITLICIVEYDNPDGTKGYLFQSNLLDKYLVKS